MTVTLTRNDNDTKNEPPRDCIRFAVNGSTKRSTVLWDAHGWLTQIRRDQETEMVNPLTRHAEWLGPVKLVSHRSRLSRVTEMYLPHSHFNDCVFETEATDRRDELFEALLKEVFIGRSRTKIDGWIPPDAAVIAVWLNDAGRSVSVDDDDNLRLTLKSRGCDGQVRVSRGEGRLRLTMRLGSWGRLDPIAEKAMLELAGQANTRGRLVRIAWIEAEDKRRCEAQVDLSGMPTSAVVEPLWPDVVRSAVDGLELALRWLGMELDALADVRNRRIAEQLLKTSKRRGQKPR